MLRFLDMLSVLYRNETPRRVYWNIAWCYMQILLSSACHATPCFIASKSPCRFGRFQRGARSRSNDKQKKCDKMIVHLERREKDDESEGQVKTWSFNLTPKHILCVL
jgi:hypothetical protein